MRNCYALAPMAGLSDVPFRTLAWRMGAGYMVSEMVSARPELWETGKSRLRRVPVPGADPVAVQIAGTEPELLADAARRHVQDGVQVIDINFGCPAKKVCRKSAGSALLADLDLIARIVSRVAAAVDVPVTVKTRTGLKPGDELGVRAGLVAAQNGARMVVMHGRSRACKFKGAVDYAPVRRLVEALRGTDVSVMVNGDIDSAQSARAIMTATGAQGVMVGRAAIGAPWIFADLTGQPLPSRSRRWQLIVEHVHSMHEFYGPRSAVGPVRKHVMAYLQQFDLGSLTPAFMQVGEARAQLEWLQRVQDADLHDGARGDLRRAAVDTRAA